MKSCHPSFSGNLAAVRRFTTFSAAIYLAASQFVTQAEPLVYEPFAYDSSSLARQADGVGLSPEAWQGNPDIEAGRITPGLTFGGKKVQLVTDGAALSVKFPGDGQSGIFTRKLAVDKQVKNFWMSYLYRWDGKDIGPDTGSNSLDIASAEWLKSPPEGINPSEFGIVNRPYGISKPPGISSRILGNTRDEMDIWCEANTSRTLDDGEVYLIIARQTVDDANGGVATVNLWILDEEAFESVNWNSASKGDLDLSAVWQAERENQVSLPFEIDDTKSLVIRALTPKNEFTLDEIRIGVSIADVVPIKK